MENKENLDLPYWTVGDELVYSVQKKRVSSQGEIEERFNETWSVLGIEEKNPPEKSHIKWKRTSDAPAYETKAFGEYKIKSTSHEIITKLADDSRVLKTEFYISVTEPTTLPGAAGDPLLNPGEYKVSSEKIEWITDKEYTREITTYDHQGMVIATTQKTIYGDLYWGTKRATYEEVLRQLQTPTKGAFQQDFEATLPNGSFSGSLSISQLAGEEITLSISGKDVKGHYYSVEREQNRNTPPAVMKVQTSESLFVTGWKCPVLLKELGKIQVDYPASAEKNYTQDYEQTLVEGRINQLRETPIMDPEKVEVPQKESPTEEVSTETDISDTSIEPSKPEQPESIETAEEKLEPVVVTFGFEGDTIQIPLTTTNQANLRIKVVSGAPLLYGKILFDENPWNFKEIPVSVTEGETIKIPLIIDTTPGFGLHSIKAVFEAKGIDSIESNLSVQITSRPKSTLPRWKPTSVDWKLDEGVPRSPVRPISIFEIAKGASSKTRSTLESFGDTYPSSFLKCFNNGKTFFEEGNFPESTYYFQKALFILQKYLEEKYVWPITNIAPSEKSEFHHEVVRLGEASLFLANAFINAAHPEDSPEFLLDAAYFFSNIEEPLYEKVSGILMNFARFAQDIWKNDTHLKPLIEYAEILESRIPRTFSPELFRQKNRPPLPYQPGFMKLWVAAQYKKLNLSEGMETQANASIDLFNKQLAEFSKEITVKLQTLQWITAATLIKNDRTGGMDLVSKMRAMMKSAELEAETRTIAPLGPEIPITLDIMNELAWGKNDKALEILNSRGDTLEEPIKDIFKILAEDSPPGETEKS